MLCKLSLSAVALAVTAMAANAADLPARTRLGLVFADPAESRPGAFQTTDISAAIVARLMISPPVPGYYGKPSDFDYSPYYGGSSDTFYDRLPYACGRYGYC